MYIFTPCHSLASIYILVPYSQRVNSSLEEIHRKWQVEALCMFLITSNCHLLYQTYILSFKIKLKRYFITNSDTEKFTFFFFVLMTNPYTVLFCDKHFEKNKKNSLHVFISVFQTQCKISTFEIKLANWIWFSDNTACVCFVLILSGKVWIPALLYHQIKHLVSDLLGWLIEKPNEHLGKPLSYNYLTCSSSNNSKELLHPLSV